MSQHPPRPTLFPYTTLFRSRAQLIGGFGGTTPGRSRGTQTRSAPGEMVQTTGVDIDSASPSRSEEHTSELQSHVNLVCRLLLEKKKTNCNATAEQNRTTFDI